MARKFRIPTSRIKFANRCIFCGRPIRSGFSVCIKCRRKTIRLV